MIFCMRSGSAPTARLWRPAAKKGSSDSTTAEMVNFSKRFCLRAWRIPRRRSEQLRHINFETQPVRSGYKVPSYSTSNGLTRCCVNSPTFIRPERASLFLFYFRTREACFVLISIFTLQESRVRIDSIPRTLTKLRNQLQHRPEVNLPDSA